MLTTTGIELKPTDMDGVHSVVVKDASAKLSLSWDRFVRLKAAADAVQLTESRTILDAGGFDGALGLFLQEREISLIDPATTGGSVLEIPCSDKYYDAVVAVDLLEHIEPSLRVKALSEFARVARQCIILNYPCKDSKQAQELALRLTNNDLIRDHVMWELPDSAWVLDELARHGFAGEATPHTSIAIWLGQYISLNLLPETAKDLNRHLVDNYVEEPCSKALYHLLVCNRTGH